MSKRTGRPPIFVSPDQYEVGGIEGGNVGLRLSTPEIEALLPALDLVLRLAPADARSMAAALMKWSELVEGPQRS